MKRKLLVMLIILLSFPAFVYAGETVDVTVTGIYDYTSAYEVLDIVNAERQKAGIAPVSMNETLLGYAMQRAAEVAFCYGHERPDGTSCFTIFGDGYNWGALAENIASGQRNPENVMNSWMNSPGHRTNLMNPGYNSAGIGCFYQEEIGRMVWVQLFSDNTDGGYEISGNVRTKVKIKSLRENISDLKAYNLSLLDNYGFASYRYICPGKTEEFRLLAINANLTNTGTVIDTDCYYFEPASDNIAVDGRNITVLSEGEASFDFYVGGKYIGSHSFMAEHDFVDAGTPPSCTEPGYTGGVCRICEYSEEKIMIPPLGHNEIIKEGYEPTCINAGRTDALYCDRCREYLSTADFIPAKGHDLVKNVIAPTCVNRGYDEYFCKNCDYVTVDRYSYVPETGHNYGEWKVNEETMEKISVCENCGDMLIGATAVVLLDDVISTLKDVTLSFENEATVMELKDVYDSLSESQRAALEYEKELLEMISIFEFYHMGDINLDGKICSDDLSMLLGEYSYTYSASDIAGGDNVVNADDLSMLLSCYRKKR